MILVVPPEMLLDTSGPDVGVYNSNLAAQSMRIFEGATWKRQRIVVILPTAKLIHARVALAQWQLIFPLNNGLHRMLAFGTEVGIGYSHAVEHVLNDTQLNEWEYILTIEHDNLPPADGVLRLIESMDKHPELSAISGLYWTKGEGGMPMIFGDIRDEVINFRPQWPRPYELQECNGIPMGFALWRIAMFKDERLRRPWFRTRTDAMGVSGQDLYFWADARKKGYRCAVDCRVLVGHMDLKTEVVW